MQKYTEYALFLLRMEFELWRTREVAIEFHKDIYKHKYEIVEELFNEGYIDGYIPDNSPMFCCTLSEKAMAIPVLIAPKGGQTK